jgi:endonuclease/exonuclease/phosphatase (EEP) superfamily protein YafD
MVSASGILRLAVVVGLGPLIGLFGAYHWTLDLFNHFQAQYSCFLLIASLSLAFWRKWKHAAIASTLLLVPAVRLAPLYFPTRTSGFTPALRVASFNVLGQNKRYADAVEWIEKTDPDFIYLPETDEKWGDGLAPLSKTYPYGVDAYFEGNFGSSFRSKLPLVHREIHRFGRMRIPLIQVVVATPNGELTVFGAHPLPPVTGFWADERDIYLRGLVNLASEADGRVVILGDMNATRWSHSMSPFFARGFHDTGDGHGFSATWMRSNPLMAIPIDMILTKGFSATIRRQTGPDLGSDHRPVTAELAW